jgi:hypothetical protein
MSIARFRIHPQRQVKRGHAFIWCIGLGCLLLGCLECRLAWAASDLPTAQVALHARRPPSAPAEAKPQVVLIGLGDSLTHGTMDGTNNAVNTLHAYLQNIAASLRQVTTLAFSQPLFDVEEQRLRPLQVPTNLGVDGADAFSLEGISYYKRAGVEESFITNAYLCDKRLPGHLEDDYDKVLYPINLLAHQPVSQLDAAIWHLDRLAAAAYGGKVLVIFWVGNNDSSTAALGAGGENPAFIPLPLEQIEPEITPSLRLVLRVAQQQGALSFAAYTMSTIERNLTALQDFVSQYEQLLTRLDADGRLTTGQVELFLLTLPYYSSVGYLFDSDDLEYYLQKLNPTYTVPPTFTRVAPPGAPITDPLKGDRVSLLTFGLMYALLHSGYAVEYVNQALEIDGQQRDDLVLSEAEQSFIRARIDGFNATIKAAAASRGPQVHLVDIGQYLNDVVTGVTPIVVDGRRFSREWIRGSSFSFDGVHPGYTGQAFVANFVLARLNEALGLDAPLHDLSTILASDPYVDRDGDGWAPGPAYQAAGLTELLFLFKDPNDADAATQVELPADVWDLISRILLRELLDLPQVRSAAERLGRVVPYP